MKPGFTAIPASTVTDSPIIRYEGPKNVSTDTGIPFQLSYNLNQPSMEAFIV